MATISSRLDDNGNWITIEAAASGAFSKQLGGEDTSPTTALDRSIETIGKVCERLSETLPQSRGITVSFGIKIAPTGEVMLTGTVEDCQFRVAYAIP